MSAEYIDQTGRPTTSPDDREGLPPNVGRFVPHGPTQGYRDLLSQGVGVVTTSPFPTPPLTEGTKYDDGKIPYHLIAPEILAAIAEILAFGAKKYAPRNWEKGMAWHRPFRACLGHLWDWWARKGPDPETGKSHLWHAACCIMFLVTYEARGLGTDDRPGSP